MNNTNESNVIYLKKPKRFSLNEAKRILPEVRQMTDQAVEFVEPMVERIQESSNPEEQYELSLEVQQAIDDWTEKIQRLGAVPKGLWLVDFDSGSGYFCWQYNEGDLGFFHAYNEGFSNRVPIQ
ncbi:MAG: DUF2203 domain-containing protein [Bdellovibrionales bacterium]|nr:DUF2203 domain-containing protein [Bdellovibrionales bacterium]